MIIQKRGSNYDHLKKRELMADDSSLPTDEEVACKVYTVNRRGGTSPCIQCFTVSYNLTLENVSLCCQVSHKTMFHSVVKYHTGQCFTVWYAGVFYITVMVCEEVNNRW